MPNPTMNDLAVLAVGQLVIEQFFDDAEIEELTLGHSYTLDQITRAVEEIGKQNFLDRYQMILDQHAGSK